MTNLNVPLLRKTLEHITAHPEEWNQDVWASQQVGCGTRYCLAGTAVILSGEYDIDWRGRRGDDNYTSTDNCVELATGDVWDIEVTARHLLVLDDSWLFGGLHSLRDLWEIASQLTGGEIKVPEDLPDVTAS